MDALSRRPRRPADEHPHDTDPPAGVTHDQPGSAAVHPVLLPEAQSLLDAAVAALLLSGRFAPQERQDLRQELLLAALARWPSYCPARGSTGAFLTVLWRSKAANLLRDRLAQARRQARRAAGQRQRPAAACAGQAARRVDLRLDVESVLLTLPAPLARVATGLLRQEPAEVGRGLRMTRHGLRKALRELGGYFRPLAGQGQRAALDGRGPTEPWVRPVARFLPNATSGGDPIKLADLLPVARLLDWKQQRKLWRELCQRVGLDPAAP